jgi:hypothetical protein
VGKKGEIAETDPFSVCQVLSAAQRFETGANAQWQSREEIWISFELVHRIKYIYGVPDDNAAFSLVQSFHSSSFPTGGTYVYSRFSFRSHGWSGASTIVTINVEHRLLADNREGLLNMNTS